MRGVHDTPQDPNELQRRLFFQQWLNGLVDAVRESFREMTNRERMIFCHAFLMNLVGPIPRADFMEMLESAGQPCGKEGCDCHESMAALMNVIEDLRETFRQGTGMKDE